MSLSEDEKNIEAAALQYAKEQKKAIAKAFTDKTTYPSEQHPVSVFMAGSPGAGKTEASIEFLTMIGGGVNRSIRIDADELRSHFEGYSGSNSYLFQRGVSVLVEKTHDLVLKQKQSFLMDGTLSNLNKARDNITRSLAKDRIVQILYVYQEPHLAWQFVQAREKIEGRRILLEHFIAQYFSARDNVNQLKQEFGSTLKVDLLLKNTDNSTRSYKAKIDNHIPEKYTPEDLQRILLD